MPDLSWPPLVSLRRQPLAARSVAILPQSAYVDTFWMPILGPLATSTLRLLVRLTAPGGPTPVALEELASSLGIRGDDPVLRLCATLGQLVDAQILDRSQDDDAALGVPSDLPLLRPEQVAMLPDHLRSLHVAWAVGRPDARIEPPSVSAGFLTITCLADEALADEQLSPLRAVQRWRQTIRLASEFHTDLLTSIAPPSAHDAITELQTVSQAFIDAVWSAGGALARDGAMTDQRRHQLRESAAAVVDWLVTESAVEPDLCPEEE